MAERTLTPVTEGYGYLEGPRWHEGRLWFSDFYTNKVYATTVAGQAEVIAEVAGQPSGLGWLPDGRLLIVSMKDRKLLRREPDGSLVQHADLWGASDFHLNDMVVSADGHAYVGNFGYDIMAGMPHRATMIAKVDPDGTVTVAADGIDFPNGAVITPDGRTLLLNELFGNKITAFDIGDKGELSNRRDWASFGPLPDTDDLGVLIEAAAVAPDGSTLDAEGAVWVADATHHRALRIAEGGRILEEIPTGDEGTFAVALGGDDGRTLFLCVAPSFDEQERKATRLGRIVSTPVGVPHAGLP